MKHAIDKTSVHSQNRYEVKSEKRKAHNHKLVYLQKIPCPCNCCMYDVLYVYVYVYVYVCMYSLTSLKMSVVSQVQCFKV